MYGNCYRFLEITEINIWLLYKLGDFFLTLVLLNFVTCISILKCNVELIVIFLFLALTRQCTAWDINLAMLCQLGTCQTLLTLCWFIHRRWVDFLKIHFCLILLKISKIRRKQTFITYLGYLHIAFLYLCGLQYVQVFPLDYILMTGVIVYFVLCSMAGVRIIGIWFLWIRVSSLKSKHITVRRAVNNLCVGINFPLSTSPLLCWPRVKQNLQNLKCFSGSPI